MPRAPVVEPLPPFATITEERADIMFKLQRATTGTAPVGRVVRTETRARSCS